MPTVRLSQREEQILDLAASGLLDKEIVQRLRISSNTIKTYWRRIRSKLGEKTRSALIAEYVQQASAGEPSVDYDWESDLRTGIWRKVSASTVPGQETMPRELPREESHKYFHPDDSQMLKRMVEQVRASDIPAFFYKARLMSPHGVVQSCCFVQVVRDENGEAVLLRGVRTHLFEVADPDFAPVEVGDWTFDLDSEEWRFDSRTRELLELRLADSCGAMSVHDRLRNLIDAAIRSRRQHFRDTYALLGASHRWAAIDFVVEGSQVAGCVQVFD